jgi:hypothetical protein
MQLPRWIANGSSYKLRRQLPHSEYSWRNSHRWNDRRRDTNAVRRGDASPLVVARMLLGCLVGGRMWHLPHCSRIVLRHRRSWWHICFLLPKPFMEPLKATWIRKRTTFHRRQKWQGVKESLFRKSKVWVVVWGIIPAQRVRTNLAQNGPLHKRPL